MLRFNGQRAQNTIIVTSIYWLIYVYYAITNFLNYDPSFEVELQPLIEINLRWSQIFNYIEISLGITQSIVFMQWFRRAYYNLHQKTNDLAYTDGWAVASWLIPIVNLYRPFVIMKELYIKTEKILEEQHFITFRKTNTTILTIWWVIYVVNTIIGWVSFFYVFFMYNGGSIEMFYKLVQVNHIIFIIFTVIHLKIIRDYSIIENLLQKFDDKKQTDEHDLDENE